MEVGQEMCDRFEEGRAVQFLASLERGPDFGNLDCIPKMKTKAAKGKSLVEIADEEEKKPKQSDSD